MDENCPTCTFIFKRLDVDDTPIRYAFKALSPEEAIALVEQCLHKYSRWQDLKVEKSQRSFGGLRAILMRVRYLPPGDESELVLIAQAQPMDEGDTQLYFRYGFPKDACDHPVARSFAKMIEEILNVLQEEESAPPAVP